MYCMHLTFGELYFLSKVITVRSMCFTWTFKKDVLRLVCKIDQLMFEVAILDRNGKEKGSCLFPWSESKCISYHPNGHISQDIGTNTTILTVWQVENDDSVNGNWTCRHGRGKEKATAEVTITMRDYSNGFEKNLTWTFIGLIVTELLLNVVVLVRSFKKCSGRCCIRTSFNLLKCFKTLNPKERLAFYWFVCLISIALFSAIPIYLDSLGKSIPISAKIFIANGFILGIGSHAMSKIYWDEENENKPCETDEQNQEKEKRPNLTQNDENAHLLDDESPVSSEELDVQSNDHP